MPCYHPLQAFYDVNGKIQFHRFFLSTPGENDLLLPCGRCIGCRLERSRQWALRCLHESKMYRDNCFITLTYDEEHLPLCGSNGSLVKSHFQDFMKRLRKKFSDRRIRVFYCGEYGENFSRPHFHACLFNFDFKDKVLWKRSRTERLYVSDTLSSLWTFGFHSIGSVSFESAGYIARYCTKKILGSQAEEHYAGRMPEFCGMSLKPGIGRDWLDKFGKTDVFPFDSCVVKGGLCKPPRYYDKLLEKHDPERFEAIRDARIAKAKDRADDNTYARLLVKEKCVEDRFRKLIRTIERS